MLKASPETCPSWIKANLHSLLLLLLGGLRLLASAAGLEVPNSAVTTPSPLDYIGTGFENASPLWYNIAKDGTVHIYLLYDHERSSPNRAAGHFHFLVQARPAAELTLEFENLDNVWNGQPASIAKELRTVMVSTNETDWTPVPVESLPENRVILRIRMPGPRLYVARVEPYRLSDLDRLLAWAKAQRFVRVETIGSTVGGRPLEILRIGNPHARYRVFVRARAHPWEAGGSWVMEGLIRRLLAGDPTASKYRERYCAYLLPMANKDGVAKGGTRFNLMGKDLNRNWDQPANPELAPENAALESWLERMIRTKQAPQLALELHNDGSGQLHVSRTPVPDLDRYLRRMATLERLLRQYSWFTEGSTPGTFHNSGSLGEGWLERYGIDAAVHELNCNWIAGLNDYPSARHWKDYGAELAEVFYQYFGLVQP